MLGLLALIYTVHTRTIHPLFVQPSSGIPRAHWSTPFSSLWLSYLRRGGKTGISTVIALHKKHGPIIRLSPTELSVASLEGLRTIYAGAFEKSTFYSQLANYNTPNLVSFLENKAHSIRKRMLSHVYSKSYIFSSELQDISKAIVYEQLGPVLQQILKNDMKEWAEVDAYTLNQALGVDFMSAFLFGIPNATNFVSDFDKAREFLQMWKIKSRELPGHEFASKRLEDVVLDMCRKSENSKGIVYSRLSEQLQSGASTGDRYGVDRHGDIKTRQVSNELNIASEIFDHLFAGIETARITLTYLQHELSLAHNHALQKSLRTELLTLSPTITFSLDHSLYPKLPTSCKSELPDARSIDSLPLLDAILKETLRLYPPSPAPLPRVVPVGGTVLHGFKIPAGTVVGISSHVLHQNEDVFPEPRSWKPERWLNGYAIGSDRPGGEERLKEMNRWFWAFGSGGRMCLGSHFAVYCMPILSIFGISRLKFSPAYHSLSRRATHLYWTLGQASMRVFS
jgi:cytochrome P450